MIRKAKLDVLTLYVGRCFSGVWMTWIEDDKGCIVLEPQPPPFDPTSERSAQDFVYAEAQRLQGGRAAAATVWEHA
jgi:hypothetical protein